MQVTGEQLFFILRRVGTLVPTEEVFFVLRLHRLCKRKCSSFRVLALALGILETQAIVAAGGPVSDQSDVLVLDVAGHVIEGLNVAEKHRRNTAEHDQT